MVIVERKKPTLGVKMAAAPQVQAKPDGADVSASAEPSPDKESSKAEAEKISA